LSFSIPSPPPPNPHFFTHFLVYGSDKLGLDELKYDLEIVASMDENFSLEYSFLDDLAVKRGVKE